MSRGGAQRQPTKQDQIVTVLSTQPTLVEVRGEGHVSANVSINDQSSRTETEPFTLDPRNAPSPIVVHSGVTTQNEARRVLPSQRPLIHVYDSWGEALDTAGGERSMSHSPSSPKAGTRGGLLPEDIQPEAPSRQPSTLSNCAE